jgi:hypothetical protein
MSEHRSTGWAARRDQYAVPVLFNPYTGDPRDVRDVQSDPQGILIVPPGKVEMLAAKPTHQQGLQVANPPAAPVRPVQDLHFFKQVLSVAIAGLYEHYKQDVLKTFSIDELSEVADLSESLQPRKVEDIYKQMWVMLSTPPAQPAPAPAIPMHRIADVESDEIGDMRPGRAYREGWNACRAAMLKAQPAPVQEPVAWLIPGSITTNPELAKVNGDKAVALGKISTQQWNPEDHYKDGWRDALESVKRATQPGAQPAPDNMSSILSELNALYGKITPPPYFVAPDRRGIGLSGNRWTANGAFQNVLKEGVSRHGGTSADNMRFICSVVNSWTQISVMLATPPAGQPEREPVTVAIEHCLSARNERAACPHTVSTPAAVMADLKWAVTELEALDDATVQVVIDVLKRHLVAGSFTPAQPAQPEIAPDYWIGYGLQAHTEKPFEGATPVWTSPPAQRQPLIAWQPIETAPKDGSSYLIADAVRGFVAPHIRGVIHNNPGTSWDWQYGEEATHWMPLPDAPAAHGITGEKTCE